MSISIGWTDALVYILMIFLIVWLKSFRKTDEWQLIREQLIERPRYVIMLMILSMYGVIGFLDTLHFKSLHDQFTIKSVLDVMLSPRNQQSETTYSAPFALYSYDPEIIKSETGAIQEVFPKLKFAGQDLKNLSQDRAKDITVRLVKGIIIGLLFVSFLLLFLPRWRFFSASFLFHPRVRKPFWITIGIMACLIGTIMLLLTEYHILGTDKVGRDVFYIAVKSIRTGLVIGTVTLLVTVPLALIFGMWAGYFGGWIDDIIQYTYTTLSSIPGVLLIAAAMLSFQTVVESDPDLRLVILCIILGVTSWTTLCRLLRGETLKLRGSDFVQSAITLGTPDFTIIRRHIMPNLIHIVIITVVLDFSGLVLAEAILSYVGVGVDPTSFSWGTLINASRLEMARVPTVWWSLFGALTLMFTLVFAANVFADALQDAFNPRTGGEV